MSLKKEPGDCYRQNGRARRRRAGSRSGSLDPASRSRFVLSTDQVVRFSETVSEPEGPRCADDGSGPEFEVHFSPFKGVILRYIWTFGQIFSTAFMNRSR